VVRENLRERKYSDAKCFDARRQDVGAKRLTAQKPAPEKTVGSLRCWFQRLRKVAGAENDCGKARVLR
jgi:hypothetical protein